MIGCRERSERVVSSPGASTARWTIETCARAISSCYDIPYEMALQIVATVARNMLEEVGIGFIEGSEEVRGGGLAGG